MKASEVKGKRFSVIGGARSGIAVAKLLKRNGANVFLSDSATPEKMLSAAGILKEAGIEAEFGTNSRRILDADILVLSPGVPAEIPVVREALKGGKVVVSEVEVASWFCAAPIIAVTGTNGKTTTTTLIGQMFADAQRPSVVGGNIGIAFSQVVDGMTSGTTAILEISSFQLDFIERFRPSVSVVLNITPDHLDRYDHSFEKYTKSKARIFENQNGGDTIVYNDDDTVTRTVVRRDASPSVRMQPFSATRVLDSGAFIKDGDVTIVREGRETKVLPVASVKIRGIHNLQNAMAASLASAEMGVPIESIGATLKSFPGVEHRLEPVREFQGVSFVNDSKATNVDSVWYALQSFTSPIVLLLGGRDKGNDYGRLLPLVKQHVRSIVALGESAGKVVSAFTGTVPVRTASSMKDAVRIAAEEARRGDVVLLSPACASFDWFENYEHRGRIFKQEVGAL